MAQSDASTPLPGALASSYAQPYASGLRSSRVAVAPRRYEGLHRVEVGWPPSSAGTPQSPQTEGVEARFVLVPPDAAHIAVDWGQRFDTRDARGGCIYVGRKEAYFDLAVSDGGAYIYGNELLWDGRSGPSHKVTTGNSAEGSILAMRYEGDRRLIAVQNLPELPHGGGGWGIQVYQDRFTAADHTARVLVASNGYDGKGVAAVAGDFRTVLVTQDRTLRILSGEGDPATAMAPELLRKELPYDVRLLSIAPPHILLVTDDATGGTSLRCLEADGNERWSARLPFSRGEDPPVDLGGGRALVTGRGLAAIEDGKIVWSAPSPTAVRATAFADGTLAVASGGELRIVDRDGAIRQVLHAAEGETITTPPGIGHDGSVWVATGKALYVAR
jgi:outer membrane protein assembly factor BamB